MTSFFKHQHIIVFIEHNEHNNEETINKALRLAQNNHSRITLFCVGYNSELVNSHSFDDDNIERAKNSFLHQLQVKIEKICKPLIDKNSDINIHIKTCWNKHSVEAVYEYNQVDPGDIIIKSSHHHSFLQRTFLKNIDWELIRKSFIPTLFVKTKSWPEQLNIVSCVDPIHHQEHQSIDEKIIHLAQSILKLSSNEANPEQHHVLHAFDPTPLMMYMDQPAIDAQMISSQIKKSHKLKLAEMTSKLNLKEELVHLEQGSPLSVIPEFVNKNDYQIVVLGGVCRHGIERLLIGNTAEKILDEIDADLLVTPIFR